jgi:kanamycin kinase
MNTVTFPTEQPTVPELVAQRAAGRPVSAVWRNALGGTTFRIGAGDEYVKVCPSDLFAEALRMNWARQFTTVPEVLGVGPGWLHTGGIRGRSAVDPHWIARPVAAARAIGLGLRALHDTLPVPDCPFGPPPWIPADAPTPDLLVVCHGDACAPNTLIADDGSCAGHVDLGDMGVADRWSDLAVASMSLAWNYGGPGHERSASGMYTRHEEVLFDAYGVAPDHERIAYYRLRWDEEPPAAR